MSFNTTPNSNALKAVIAILFSATAFSACADPAAKDGDIAPAAEFAEATDQDILEAYVVAAGMDWITASMYASVIDMMSSEDRCIKTTVIGDAVRYEADRGCPNPNLATSGALTVRGYSDVGWTWSQTEPEGRIEFIFDRLELAGEVSPAGVIDGRIVTDYPTSSSAGQVTVELESDFLGEGRIVNHSNIRFEDVGPEGWMDSMTYESGSRAEVEGLGSFSLSGSWADTIELSGVDTMRFDMANSSDECLIYEIADEVAELCL